LLSANAKRRREVVGRDHRESLRAQHRSERLIDDVDESGWRDHCVGGHQDRVSSARATSSRRRVYAPPIPEAGSKRLRPVRRTRPWAKAARRAEVKRLGPQ
jgi:hypothetical protein